MQAMSFKSRLIPKNITPEYIQKLNYPDFVAFVNQWNVLPGSHITVNKWRVFGQVTEKSNILQFACTTGFQSREMSLMTGCSGKAFDLSVLAVEVAAYNQANFGPHGKITYFDADGENLDLKETFSHVLVGAGLRFFPNPDVALQRCVAHLEDGGKLLASPFYIAEPIPADLIQRFKGVFGIVPTLDGYKDIMQPYNSFEVLYEDRNDIYVETEGELKTYCEATIRRACEMHGLKSEEAYAAMYERLYKVKEMSNLLRPYQRYSVLVCRYRKGVYPNRYVELF